MSVREQFEQAFHEFSPNPDSAVYREFGELMYRAGMERGEEICEEQRQHFNSVGHIPMTSAATKCRDAIHTELSALDADSRRCEASKSGDKAEVVAEGGENGEMAKNEPVEGKRHGHYFKPCPYDEIDVYRVIELWGITDPCQQHALKKILCMGGRGHKDALRDAQDVIDTMERWKGMRREEALTVLDGDRVNV